MVRKRLGLQPVPFKDGRSVVSRVAVDRVPVCFCSPARGGRCGSGQNRKGRLGLRWRAAPVVGCRRLVGHPWALASPHLSMEYATLWLRHGCPWSIGCGDPRSQKRDLGHPSRVSDTARSGDHVRAEARILLGLYGPTLKLGPDTKHQSRDSGKTRAVRRFECSVASISISARLKPCHSFKISCAGMPFMEGGSFNRFCILR
jgi:hypothetical protein